MLKLLMFIMMYLSTLMVQLNSPLMLGMIILLQTIVICLISRMMTFSSWIPLTMFLVMVGGLMVIFLYTTSVCSNNKFIFLKTMNMNIIIISLILYIFDFNYNLMNDSIQLMDSYNFEFKKLFMEINLLSSVFMFMYLIFALIIMIKLLNNNKGPMRKKY